MRSNIEEDSILTELEDRWILPLRDQAVMSTTWRNNAIELATNEGSVITVGTAALLSPGHATKSDPDRRPLITWDASVVEEVVCARIISSVGFKSGTLRVKFANGWTLLARKDDAVATVRFSDGRSWRQTPSGAVLD
ncbi:DUF6188 family protein [Nocardia sp. NPDC050378]|uniref:DUF6188 family protein n=1 Tax=Nocardia sp. NPDC050378 TaxID=3155400 RepID=UPI00340D4B0B